MICQVSAEITGAGIAEFHTPMLLNPPPPTPQTPLLSAITGRLAGEGDGEHLWKSVCVYVCVYGWLNMFIK